MASEFGRDAGAAMDSRERLVDAAAELVIEHFSTGTGQREVFAYLTPGAVAARAGLSRALIYHHWDDADATGATSFERFLGDVSDRLWVMAVAPGELGEIADALPTNFSDLVVALTEWELGRATGRDAALWRASISLSLNGVLSREQSARSVDDLARLHHQLGVRLGVEPVSPLTYRDIAAALLAMIDGFAISYDGIPELSTKRYAWEPRVPRDSGEGDWALLAIAVEGLLLHMTKPVDGDWPPRS